MHTSFASPVSSDVEPDAGKIYNVCGQCSSGAALNSAQETAAACKYCIVQCTSHNCTHHLAGCAFLSGLFKSNVILNQPSVRYPAFPWLVVCRTRFARKRKVIVQDDLRTVLLRLTGSQAVTVFPHCVFQACQARVPQATGSR